MEGSVGLQSVGHDLGTKQPAPLRSAALLEHRVPCAESSLSNVPGHRIHTPLAQKQPPLNPFPRPELLLHQKPGEKDLYARIVKVVRWNSCHHKLWRNPLLTLGVGFWINQSHMVSGGKSVLKRCDL